MFLCGFSQLKAQGTSLAVLLLPVGIFAFIEYYKKGQVNIQAGILIVIFLSLGQYLEQRSKTPLGVLKKSFGILMILISLKMIFSK